MHQLFPFFLVLLLISCNEAQNSKEFDSNKDAVNTLEESFPNPLISRFSDEDSTDYLFPKTDSIYFETGELSEVINYSSNTEYIYKMFNRNGVVIEIGEQGEVLGCGSVIGVTKYNNEGELKLESIYDYWLPGEDDGCHAILFSIFNTYYYPNGKIKAKEQLETCYECDECPCGIWEYYDEEGNLTNRHEYGDCFDAKMECVDEPTIQ